MARLSDIFAALANENRLRIVQFLMNPSEHVKLSDEERRMGAVCVCRIVGFLQMAEPTVSHHLACLRRAGLIKCDRRGRWIFYSIDWRGVNAFKKMVRETFKKRATVACG